MQIFCSDGVTPNTSALYDASYPGISDGADQLAGQCPIGGIITWSPMTTPNTHVLNFGRLYTKRNAVIIIDSGTIRNIVEICLYHKKSILL